jgi:hypothetical protein
MKINGELYAQIEAGVSAMMAKYPESRSKYQERGLTPRRWRWDLFWAAQDAGYFVPGYADGVNDDHIDTTLRRITGTKVEW